MIKNLSDYKCLTPSLYGNDGEEKREEILKYFLETYELFEKLFEPLKDDKVFYKSPEPTRHPLIFYFGHTATFFINKLVVSKAIEERINPNFESMFAIGVDEMSWDDMDNRHYAWPTVDETREYRAKVKAFIVDEIKSRPINLPITWEDDFWWIILMGIEHERIHLETSSVLHRQLDVSDVVQDDFWRIHSDTNDSTPVNRLIDINKGKVSYGKSHSDDYYAWDNEYGEYSESIDAFKVSQNLVSNGEFMPFVKAHGYSQKSYWDDEGWQWLKEDKRSYPHFWVKNGGTYVYRTMLSEIDMPLSWPVDINYHEAKAFCRYKSEQDEKHYRLPTEAEWYYLCERANINQEIKDGNIHLKHQASSMPVDSQSFGELNDLVGNVWQWTETHMDGLEGFKPHPAYDDFSTPTFDNKHNILKGGSWISTGNATMKSSRYAFRRHFMQHAGFRYIQSDKELKVENVNTYETDSLVSQYCDFHYGHNHFGVENLAISLVDIALKYQDKNMRGRVFDLGCAVGRASFELSKHFDAVTALDFSASFVQVGTHLKEGGSITYKRHVEGDIIRIESVDLESIGAAKTAEKIEFMQGDACNLKPHFTNYDLVIASNLIDRLYDPMLFLNDIKHRVNQGGLLVISSPYTWLEEFTHKDHWLGGYEKDGKEVTTLDGLKAALEDSFELVDEPIDTSFVIRETARKFQHTVAQVSVWRKK
jgi:5-histidylcysteine sulfoxide synthase/putative 4-mercaptohistidine N1-methyltranferase